ncbi:20508_t:CDS:1 [Gigaspora margarita]|uniref:20508_t:CDS:1 n=1 Tax=Gigaspora margarita TaxID=4874 RepID=A0ABM8W7C3_GIGMA|nr:20508_t:CDS:1 [Gigaspora margarita]
MPVQNIRHRLYPQECVPCKGYCKVYQVNRINHERLNTSPQITEIDESGPIVHYHNQNINNQSGMPYKNNAQVQANNNDNLQPSSFEISSYQDNIRLQQPRQDYDQSVTNYQFQHQPRQDFASNFHQNNFSTQQHIHNRSNTINQTSQQNNYPQQIFSQNRELITMMQNLSNNTSTIQNALQTILQNTLQRRNNDAITLQTNSQLPNSDINDSQNTPSDSNTALNQHQESIHQINICDPCKRRNFPEDPSTSINQINICDSCMKSNFPNQPNLSVSQTNNQINFTNQNLTSNQATTTDHLNISNCTNDVNINSSSWKLGYTIIFGLTFLVLGIIILIIKQLSVVSAYEQIGALFFTIKIDLGQFVKILGPTILGGIVNWIMKQRNGIKN